MSSNIKEYMDRLVGPVEPEDFDPVAETLGVLRRVAELIDDRHRPKSDDRSISMVYRPAAWEAAMINDALRRDVATLIARLESLDQAITAFVNDTAHAVGPLGTMFGEDSVDG
jgi:hypothetical protein